MDFFELIEKRQSIRKWQARPVEREKLNCRDDQPGPFGGKLSGVRGVPGRVGGTAGGDRRGDMGPGLYCFRTGDAGVLFASGAVSVRPGAVPAGGYDRRVHIAMLAVTAVGLGAVWIGAFDLKKVAEAMSLPEGQTPVAILPLGYGDEMPERTSRRELGELVHELG
jgi:hypothetical protein